MANDRKSSQHEVALVSTAMDAGDGGMTRRDVLALLAAFGVPAVAFAQDPVAVSPKSYRVMFENEKVRVLEYSNRPGLGPCGRGRHYHPAHLDVFLTQFTGKMTHEDGKVTTGTAKSGQVAWYEAEWHEVENVDKSASKVIMVELKDAHWKPSTD
jgi:beta-alanine degradation protein BauB